MADERSGEYEIVRRGTADELVEHVDGVLAAPDERTGQSVRMVFLDRLETADPALWVQLSVSNVRSGKQVYEFAHFGKQQVIVEDDDWAGLGVLWREKPSVFRLRRISSPRAVHADVGKQN